MPLTVWLLYAQRKAKEQPERWRERLTVEQVDASLAVLARFPFDLVPA